MDKKDKRSIKCPVSPVIFTNYPFYPLLLTVLFIFLCNPIKQECDAECIPLAVRAPEDLHNGHSSLWPRAKRSTA